jgi:uncharacterized protein YjbJ (UPF0337 family)
MDDNRVTGSIEEAKGGAKDAIGWAVSDAKLQTVGETDKAVGKIHNYSSGLNDAVRDAEAMKSAGPPRSDLNRAGCRLMSTIFSIIFSSVLPGGGYGARSLRH